MGRNAKSAVLALMLCGVVFFSTWAAENAAIPLVYITDLYHSPGDPDDHVDLATLLALPEFDIRAVLIDVRPPRRPDANPYDPGYIPISQLCYLTGRAIPIAVGPAEKLRSTQDSGVDRPASEQAAITLLLKVLRESREKVLVNTTGTCRIIAAAFLREPALFKEKVKALVINAGSSGAGPLEHNVEVDPLSYVIVMRSGLPILWFPCAGSTTNWNSPEASGPNNTFYRVPQQQLYAGLPPALRNWLAYALGRSNRGDILRALIEPPNAQTDAVLSRGERNLWSTASFMITSGRTLAKTADGWRFVPQGTVPANGQVEALSMIPIELSITDAAQPAWSKAAGVSPVQLFQRTPGPQHTAAMAEALNALLRAFPTVR
ncbi:MAG TPA: nucleoside hydrolase [Planctomycetota bacterium]|jgi:rhodanese-related sulfurtransferase